MIIFTYISDKSIIFMSLTLINNSEDWREHEITVDSKKSHASHLDDDFDEKLMYLLKMTFSKSLRVSISYGFDLVNPYKENCLTNYSLSCLFTTSRISQNH